MNATESKLPTVDIGELEKLAIAQALDEHTGNRTHAAKALGVSVRTLQRKIKHYGLPELPVSVAGGR